MATETVPTRTDLLEDAVVTFANLADQASPDTLRKAAREFEKHAAAYNRMATQLHKRANAVERDAKRVTA